MCACPYGLSRSNASTYLLDGFSFVALAVSVCLLPIRYKTKITTISAAEKLNVMPYPTLFAKNPRATGPMAIPESIKISSIELAVAFFSGGTSVKAQAWIIGWRTAKAIPNNAPEIQTIIILVENPNRSKPPAPEIAAGKIRTL